MSRNKCSACGKRWVAHPGIQSTCQALQTALAILRTIAITPRNRGARRSAGAVLRFLETQGVA